VPGQVRHGHGKDPIKFFLLLGIQRLGVAEGKGEQGNYPEEES